MRNPLTRTEIALRRGLWDCRAGAGNPSARSLGARGRLAVTFPLNQRDVRIRFSA